MTIVSDPALFLLLLRSPEPGPTQGEIKKNSQISCLFINRVSHMRSVQLRHFRQKCA